MNGNALLSTARFFFPAAGKNHILFECGRCFHEAHLRFLRLKSYERTGLIEELFGGNEGGCRADSIRRG